MIDKKYIKENVPYLLSRIQWEASGWPVDHEVKAVCREWLYDRDVERSIPPDLLEFDEFCLKNFRLIVAHSEIVTKKEGSHGQEIIDKYDKINSVKFVTNEYIAKKNEIEIPIIPIKNKLKKILLEIKI